MDEIYFFKSCLTNVIKIILDVKYFHICDVVFATVTVL